MPTGWNATVSVADLFSELDKLVSRAEPEERAGLVVALSARVAALAAGILAAAEHTSRATEDPDQNVSVEEAARRLGVSADWVYRNRLPFKVRIGRRVLCSVHGLERWSRQRAGA